MPIPELIEIVPLTEPVQAEITVPGSKSITNRALILAALAEGETTLQGALWSEDTQVMVDCLHKLGFEVEVQPDTNEFCDRTITVKGLGGKIPKSGTAEKPLELFVGNAGTAARFLAAMVCLGDGVYRLQGVPRMHERPQAALFEALRQLGYQLRCENGNNRLPVSIQGGYTAPSRGGLSPEGSDQMARLFPASRSCRVSIEDSSQFASALLLSAKIGGWQIEVVGENAEESPYVAMTNELCKVFPKRGGAFQIELDASSGSYFVATHFLLPKRIVPNEPINFGGLKDVVPRETIQFSVVSVRKWPASGWQIDENFSKFVIPDDSVSRLTDLGDSIMTAIVLAPLTAAGSAKNSIQFTDLARLRLQECERVVALRTELTKCGAKVVEQGDTLTVYPSELHGAEIETYHDHRMAMCFAILGLKVPGIKIINPACVKKTFPNFFQKLATPPPHGLGVEIRDGKTGRRLALEELFAD